jgi:hypothetical protein
VKHAALYVVLVASFAALASAQTTDLPPMNFLAASVTQDGAIVRFNGDVRIAACGIVTTDDATWQETEIQLGANARMQLTNGVDSLKPR